MNKVILLGRLTAGPELRQAQNGTVSCRFTLAISRPKSKNGEKEADFIKCIAWGKTAETVHKYVNKGGQIAVEGTIRTGSYQDKNHPDVTHYTTDVWVDRIDFVNSPKTVSAHVGEVGEYNPYRSNGTQKNSGFASETAIDSYPSNFEPADAEFMAKPLPF